MDEQNHLARGLAFLRTGDPRLSVEHPPLINSLAALPLLTMPEIVLPLDSPSWNRQPPDVFWYIFAEEMVWQDNRDLDIQKIVFLGRLPIVYLTIFLALIGWHFARELWGIWSAFLAFAILLFDPNILANGRYITTDLGGALFAFLASYLLWRLWQDRAWNWYRWFWAAFAIGLAFSSKLSTLVFIFIWIVLALLPLYPHQTSENLKSAFRRIGQLFLAGMAAVFVVWLIFGFDWGNFNFLTTSLAKYNEMQGPMPPFWEGIERILLLNQGGRPGYLLGQFSNQGFWYYFPIVFLAKTPVLTFALWLVSMIVLLARAKSRKKAIFLFIPVMIYFAFMMQSALNLGYRHLLPILPFITLLISGLVSVSVRNWFKQKTLHWKEGKIGLGPLPVIFSILLILSLLIINIQIHPHYLSYFNLFAGGPSDGHLIAVDSNLDWGQDLLRLKDWMAQNDVDKIKLAWFGTADPDYYGINYDPLPGFPRPNFLSQWTEPPFNVNKPEPGIYAISASNLQELPLAEKNVYAWFRDHEPDARIGYSILIFEIH